MCVMSGWVLPQGTFLEGLVGDSRKEIVMRDSEGGNRVGFGVSTRLWIVNGKLWNLFIAEHYEPVVTQGPRN
jgi:hypothetical protein